MAPEPRTLRDLYIGQLQELHSAEQQLAKALPAMVEAATDPALRRALEEHVVHTRKHIERLEAICRQLDVSPSGGSCRAMHDLIAESRSVADQAKEPAARDAGLVAAAQRIEHYEIVGYGCVRSYAHVLRDDAHRDELQELLDDADQSGHRLDEIAATLTSRAAQPKTS